MYEFQNNFAQVFSLRSSSAISSTCSGRLKIKVTLEGQMMKWSKIELFRATIPTFMHGFQNNFAQLFSLKSGSVIRIICSCWLKVKVTLEGQMIKWS